MVVVEFVFIAHFPGAEIDKGVIFSKVLSLLETVKGSVVLGLLTSWMTLLLASMMVAGKAG